MPASFHFGPPITARFAVGVALVAVAHELRSRIYFFHFFLVLWRSDLHRIRKVFFCTHNERTNERDQV